MFAVIIFGGVLIIPLNHVFVYSKHLSIHLFDITKILKNNDNVSLFPIHSIKTRIVLMLKKMRKIRKISTHLKKNPERFHKTSDS